LLLCAKLHSPFCLHVFIVHKFHVYHKLCCFKLLLSCCMRSCQNQTTTKLEEIIIILLRDFGIWIWHVLIINKYWLWHCDVFGQYFDNSIKWQTQTICINHFCFDKILIAPRWQTVSEIYNLFPFLYQCVSRYVKLVSLTLAPVKHFHSVFLCSSVFISSRSYNSKIQISRNRKSYRTI